MSWVIEEITTSTIGFVIAMVILTAVVAGGLYGYWVYANHVTLENYLWPIAEVLPYKGEYFLAVVNTGHEPFYVKQIYLKGGSVITPSQAVNPSLNWCSVSNTKLMHNQWWCGEVNQLPVAVRVCSALDPQVCSVVPVHGWQIVTFSQPTQAAFGVGNASCPILAVVNDPYNAGWKVTWSYPIGSTSPVPNPPLPNPPPNYQIYEMSGSSTYGWCINPPYTPTTITFNASITKNPPGLTCQIVPTGVSKTYSAGSVQEFTVICPITVVVNDPYNAGWQISWSGAASGSKSGSSSAKFEVITTSVNGSVTFTASIPSPFSSICSIAPTNATAYPGQTVTFTVSCTRPPYFVYVTVTGDSCGIGWTIYSSVSSISGTGNVKNAMLAIGGYTDWLQVVIWKAPNGQWNFEPGGLQVTNGSSVTFTAKCPQSSGGSGNNNYYIYVVVTNDSLGAGWKISSSVASISGTGNTNSPQQLKIGGQTDTVYASITSNPSGYACTISPSSDQVSSGATYTFTVSCVKASQPPPTPMCYFTYSASTNPPGLDHPSITGPSSLSPGSSGVFGGSADVTTVDSQGDEYQFQYWSVSSNPSGYAWSGTTDQAYFSAPLSCPSNLNSTVNVQITGTAVYQFIGCKSYSVGITLDTSGKATLSWSWCPLDPAVSWSGSGGSSGNAIYANGQVTSKLGVTSGKSSQQVPVCGNETAVYQGVNPSGGSINDQASGSVTFQVEFTCQSSSGGGKGKQ